ncbi:MULTISPECIES: tautomerase family protein [Cobetia]|nr:MULTISPECIES: 4-oxalocrotonate tautomerase family protein [Cobetia]
MEHVLENQRFERIKVVIYQSVNLIMRFDKTVSLFERANAESANNKRQCFTWNISLKKAKLSFQEIRLMPMIRAEFISGKSEEQKRELIEALTRETARVLGVREESVWVVLQEVEAENWGVAGKRLSDR